MSRVEFLIVGAGPAGVSAAHALLDAGCPVTMVDGGDATVGLPPASPYLDLRFDDHSQWHWQLGRRLEGLGPGGSSSPKLRVPGYRDIFSPYAEANRIYGEAGFQVVGALAPGGLSNAWGCGVARFHGAELGALPEDVRAALDESYARVSRRTGLSGASADRLADELGVDNWAADPIPLGPVAEQLWRRRSRSDRGPFQLGRARVAVLSEATALRGGCDLLGLCLWGCPRSATWSAAHEVSSLRSRHGFSYVPSTRIEALERDGDDWRVMGSDRTGRRDFRAHRVLLAAGTLATTRLVLDTLGESRPVRLLSNPMAAFLSVVPAMLGRIQQREFGLAQLSFALHDERLPRAFGNLFSPTGLPLNEFLEHVPLSRRAGRHVLRALLPAALVGNVFLPGDCSNHSVQLGADGSLRVRAAFNEDVHEAFARSRRAIAGGLRRLGAWMLPGSFVIGQPGADIHYAGTLPLRASPAELQCDLHGGVVGLPGLHVVDGAMLPVLPAKAHTLTIMAHADRIGRALARGPNYGAGQ